MIIIKGGNDIDQLQKFGWHLLLHSYKNAYRKMKGLENQTYLIGWIISNIVALVLLMTAFKWSRLTRLLFFLLFSWASWINWRTAMYSPADYQDYADLALSDVYSNFIRGWFKDNTLLAVGCIATCQALIAIAMLMKGWLLKIGIIGGIIFLVAIVPLGVGSGIPCTINMAIALFIVFQHKTNEYLWFRKGSPKKYFDLT
jgi:hypothetical protein